MRCSRLLLLQLLAHLFVLSASVVLKVFVRIVYNSPAYEVLLLVRPILFLFVVSSLHGLLVITSTLCRKSQRAVTRIFEVIVVRGIFLLAHLKVLEVLC